MKDVVRVASGQGFWGDSLEAPRQQVEGGPVDYLMLDYLAEVTMSILQKQKERDPSLGYARDFVGAIESVLPAISERGVKVVANAGGVNPPACAAAIRKLAERCSVSEKVKIAVVTGDDLLDRLDELIASGHTLSNMDTGEPLVSVRDKVLSANAYIGSTPIVEGLKRGANIVITGRSTDTALTMAPLRYEFGWSDTDWNKLAAGIIAGHIIECGAQCSGGNCLYDWRSIPDLANVGYPIADARPDGTFVITKHPRTGGRVSVPSVTEQLVYEMGDPREYITPDVIADFTSIHLRDAGENRVEVSGIVGPSAHRQAQGFDRVSCRIQGCGNPCLRVARRSRQGRARRSSAARASRAAGSSLRPDSHRIRWSVGDARTARRARRRGNSSQPA